MLYTFLIDLTDTFLERLSLSIDIISIKMVFPSLYFFSRSRQHKETNDLVDFWSQIAKLFGTIKRKCQTAKSSTLEFILALLKYSLKSKPMSNVFRWEYQSVSGIHFLGAQTYNSLWNNGCVFFLFLC